jgi:hypothetical protein
MGSKAGGVDEYFRLCNQASSRHQRKAELPASPAEIAAAKARQRHVFTFGILASLIPISCQILIGYFIVEDGRNVFPRADYSIVTLNFWVAQSLLLCIALATNTLVDFAKFVIDKSVKLPNVMTKVLLLLFLFVAASVYFSATILGTDILGNAFWPLCVLVPLLIILSYVIDMDLVLLEVGA